MRKLKLLFVALLSSLCCFVLAGCELVSLAFIGAQVLIQQALDDTPPLEERRLAVEITEGATITEITQGEDELILNYKEANEEVERILAFMEQGNRRILAWKENEQVIIAPGELLYVESVEGKTFAYTELVCKLMQ